MEDAVLLVCYTASAGTIQELTKLFRGAPSNRHHCVCKNLTMSIAREDPQLGMRNFRSPCNQLDPLGNSGMPKKGPMQKPKPSKEVLDMIRDTKANRRNKAAKREDFSQAAEQQRGS
jgi:hypothetical protein